MKLSKEIIRRKSKKSKEIIELFSKKSKEKTAENFLFLQFLTFKVKD